MPDPAPKHKAGVLLRLRTALHLSARLQAFVLISAAVPVLLLAGFGLFVVLRDGLLWQALAVSAAVSMLAGLPLLLLRRHKPKTAPATTAPDPDLFALRDAPAWWTPFDRATCARMMPELHAVLAQSPGWKTLPDHGLALARQVAQHYHPDNAQAHWAITPLEALAVAEALSRRYRHWLHTWAPGAQHVHIARWMWLDTQVSRLGPWVKLYGVWRKARMISPAGLLAEVRSRFLDHVFDGVADDVQLKLKTLLLRDAVYAAIDLYGGHYRHADAPLEPSPMAAHDVQHVAAAPEPLRVCLIGQTGSGKSSIVNALSGVHRSEVSALPSTDRKQLVEIVLDDDQILHLIDLPGLNTQTAPALLREITQCDMVIWALQANQPARAPDVDLREQLRLWQAGTPQHQPPVLIGVLTQIDRLAHPGSLGDPQTLISEAVDHVRSLMDADAVIALSLVQGEGNATHALARQFPVTGLRDVLTRQLETALNVQLNRRRVNASTSGISVSQEWRRAVKTGKALWQH